MQYDILLEIRAEKVELFAVVTEEKNWPVDNELLKLMMVKTINYLGD